jgi:hypothetical protein
MARCGCASTNATTCAAIVACIASNLGPGLEFSNNLIGVHISGDADNVTEIGTDNGLFTPTGSVGPGEQTWLRTVATLPAQAISATGAGIGVGPSTSPHLIEYCINNEIDMYSTTVLMGADGVALETVQGPGSSVTVFTDNPGPLDWGDGSALTMSTINYDAGTRVNPTSNNSNAPAQFLTPDGGWAGFYLNQYTGRSVAETLRMVRGRIIIDLRVSRNGVTEDEIEASIRACVQAVVDAGAQDWCIVNVPGYLDDDSLAPILDWVPLVTSQGITAAVNLIVESEAPVIQPVADIVASGATWVAAVRDDHMPDTVSDTRITELVTAGLQVMARTTSRQYWTTYNFTTLGVRVVEGPDPVYARGVRGVAGDLDYRQTFIPGLDTRTPISGALTRVTDIERGVWNGGFPRLDLPGRWFEKRYGWDGTILVNEVNQILGTICPIPNTTDYEIRLRVRREADATMTSNQEVSIFFAIPDDRDISTPTGESNVFKDGYSARITSQSTSSSFRQISIRRWTNGGFTTLVSESNTVALPTNSWADLTVRVQGSQLTFIATVAGTTRTLTIADSTWRGPYVAYSWRDEFNTGNAAYPGFIHGYTNPVDLVMYAPLS